MLPLRCSFCDHDNPSGAKFCNECGSPLHLRECPSCAAIVQRDATHCYKCGGDFTGAAEKPPAVPTELSGSGSGSGSGASDVASTSVTTTTAALPGNLPAADGARGQTPETTALAAEDEKTASDLAAGERRAHAPRPIGEAIAGDRQPLVVSAAQKLTELHRVPRRSRGEGQPAMPAEAAAAPRPALVATSSAAETTASALPLPPEQPENPSPTATPRARSLIVAVVVIGVAALATIFWYHTTRPGVPDAGLEDRQTPAKSSAEAPASDAERGRVSAPDKAAGSGNRPAMAARSTAGVDSPPPLADARPGAEPAGPAKTRSDAATFGRLLLSEPPSAGRASGRETKQASSDQARGAAQDQAAHCPQAVAAIGLCDQLGNVREK